MFAIFLISCQTLERRLDEGTREVPRLHSLHNTETGAVDYFLIHAPPQRGIFDTSSSHSYVDISPVSPVRRRMTTARP